MPKYTVKKAFQHYGIKAMAWQVLSTDGENPVMKDSDAKLLVAKGLLVEGVVKEEKKGAAKS